MTIRVLLAAGRAPIRARFRAVLTAVHDIVVVGEAMTGQGAVQLARLTRPDVLVTVMSLPDLDGTHVIRAIRADRNLASVRTLIVAAVADKTVEDAVRAGANGVCDLGTVSTHLLAGVRAVAAGDLSLSPSATRALVEALVASAPPAAPNPSELDVLTRREREILVLVGQGMSNDQIARQLVISPSTAKTHVNRAMTKLGVRDRTRLVVIGYQHGLVPVSGPGGGASPAGPVVLS